MKTIIALAIAFAAQGAFARSLAPLVCTKGQMSEDNFKQVELLAGTVEIRQHESSIYADSTQTVVSGDVVAIPNKKLQGSAEGSEYEAMVNALFVYDKASNTLTATVVIDGYTQFAGETLQCR